MLTTSTDDDSMVDISPWPSGGGVAPPPPGTGKHKQGLLCTMKKATVFLLCLVLISSLLLLGGDSSSSSTRVQFDAKLSKNEEVPAAPPVGCYLKTADRQGNFAVLEEAELQKRGCERRFPQAVIAGTKKGGTTTLKYFLSYHPDVAMATKEMKFFNSNYKKGLEWYRESMPYSTANMQTIEKTPGYFVGHSIPDRIDTLLPDAKIVIIMRDPVKRAISDFVHMTAKINCKEQDPNKKNCAKLQELEKRSVPSEEDTSSGTISSIHSSGTGSRNISNSTTTTMVQMKKISVAKSLEAHEGFRYEIHKSFQESVLFPNGTVKAQNLLVDKGVYIRHLEYWFKVFTPKRLLLLDGEKFVKDPAPTLRVIERFLGMRPYFTKDHFYYDEEKHFFCLKKPFMNCMSDSKGRDHPDVPEDVLVKLREFYRPYNARMQLYFNSTLLWSS